MCRNNEELKNRKEKSLYLQHEWIKPVIQKVRIPAHITGGVFYPEHEELVIIKSGEWEMGKTVGIKKATQNQEHILLDEKGIDITALPRTENYFKGGEE